MLHTTYHRARRFLPFLLKNIFKIFKNVFLVIMLILSSIAFLAAFYSAVSFLGNLIAQNFPGLTVNERFILGIMIIFAIALGASSIYFTVIWVINESLKDYRRAYKTKTFYSETDDMLETAEIVSSFDDTQEIKSKQ